MYIYKKKVNYYAIHIHIQFNLLVNQKTRYNINEKEDGILNKIYSLNFQEELTII